VAQRIKLNTPGQANGELQVSSVVSGWDGLGLLGCNGIVVCIFLESDAGRPLELAAGRVAYPEPFSCEIFKLDLFHGFILWRLYGSPFLSSTFHEHMRFGVASRTRISYLG
jgi:hypothetical protein